MSVPRMKIFVHSSARPVLFRRLNYMIKRFASGGEKPDTGLAEKPSAAEKTRMKAWQLYQYGGPGEMTLSTNAKIPKIEDPNEILVEVHAASVNPIDVLMRGGYASRILDKRRKRVAGSLTLGRDFSGVVVKTGATVENYKPGDEVWGALSAQRQGTHAEFTITSKHEISLKPLSLSHVEAASIPYVATTTWSGLFTISNLNQEKLMGKRVLIYGGSGGIGTFAIQLMNSFGAYITTVCGTDGVDLVKSLGADEVVDYKTRDMNVELSKMEPFDIVLDPLGEKVTGKPWNYLRKYTWAKYITLSTPLMAFTDKYGIPVGTSMWGMGQAVKFMANMRYSRDYRVGFFAPSSKVMKTIAAMVDEGKIHPVIDTVFPFHELPQAYQKVKELHGRGKTVISMKT